jgi:predicted site-specific integrase-resolvase
MGEGPWHKAPAAARYLGVSVRKLRQWTSAGRIPRSVIDGVAYFSVQDLDAFMAGGRVEGPPGRAGKVQRLVNEITGN